MKPLYIFYNPKSGRFRMQAITKMEVLAKEKFTDCIVTDSINQLQKIRLSHIIIVGGDGTVNVAINHADLQSNTFSIVALGSGNDFIKNFPKKKFTEILDAIQTGVSQSVDLLQINQTKAAVLVGIGFDAFVSDVAHRSNFVWPALKYIIPVMRHMFFYHGVFASISSDNFQFEGKVFMLSCGNSFRAGGGFKLFPKATITDGKMDVLLIEPPSVWQKLKYVWLVNFGAHLNLPIVQYFQTNHLSVTLLADDFFNTDGDVQKATYMEIIVLQGAMQVIM